MKPRFLVVCLLVAVIQFSIVLVAAPVPAQAAYSAERVANFQVSAKLLPSGALEVNEAITYDFSTEAHHGIYREIPTDYTDTAGTRFRIKLTPGSTSVDDQSVKTERSATAKLYTFKLGDPDKLLIGSHVYKLSYTLEPIVMAGDTNDILKLNLTGNGWQVPLDRVEATLDLGSLVPVSPPICYTGVATSTRTDCNISTSGSTIRVVSTRQLGAGEGVSVFADLPQQSVSNRLLPFVPDRGPSWLWILPAALAAAAAGVWVYLLGKLFRSHQLRASQTVVAQYEAPNGMTPAEVGLLLDDATGMTEITATLIDLGVRGHLKITQTQAKSLFKSAEYQFDRLPGKDPLKPYESKLLTALFGDATSIALTKTDRTKLSKAITEINSGLGKSLKDRGVYVQAPAVWRVVLPIFIPLAAFVPAIVAYVQLGLADGWNVGGFAIGVAMSLALAVLAWWAVTRPAGLTPEGAKTWAQVKGLREYLSVAEKDRLNFTDAPAKTPELFNKLLPWAVALGVERQWAKQFEGLDIEPATGWYSGYAGPLNAGLLASTIHSDFAQGVSSNFSAPSSSGSSSGGFSGGGFGGGGGGSW